MTDGVFKIISADAALMAIGDILEIYGHERTDMPKFSKHLEKDRAEITIISCKHCHKSFVPQDEDWICDYCKISNIIPFK
jgi:Zn finger protein HypA/HybF involved in hydrogenase expression